MRQLTASLLGSPRILKDGEFVAFPFKQAEAILYYLLVEREAPRSKIADLIWGNNVGDQKVKSNMRNAIYVLRKLLWTDFLIEPRKNILQINPEIDVHLDLEQLNKDSAEITNIYAGEFLQDFYLKENEYYNEWILNTRQELQQIYIDRLKQSIARRFESQDWSQCEAQAKQLISLDEYDETGYYYLMEIYRIRGEYHKAIALYDRLKLLLAEDLFQFPGERISQLTELVKQERSQKLIKASASTQAAFPTQNSGMTHKTPIYGRALEQELLVKNALQFFNGGTCISQAVIGEAGIGKSTLLNHLCSGLQTGEETFLFHASCYHAEETFALKPWQAIFEQILHLIKKCPSDKRNAYFHTMTGLFFPHLKDGDAELIDQDSISIQTYDGNERTITHALLHFAKNRKIIICIDDLQWADILTVSLIQDILTTNQNHNIMFLLGCRSAHNEHISRILEDMHLAHFLQKIVLERFSFADTVGLADSLLPRRFDSADLRKQLYHETEGNPFFIIETVNNFKYNGDLADITQNMRDTIRQRTIHLPSDCRNILDLLSLFFDGVSLPFLAELSQKQEYELVDILETLIDQQLICEKASDTGVRFQFTHQKILEYVYSELSLTKRRVLHERIANLLEGKLSGTGRDFPLYHKLMYHFERAKNQKKYLKYYIKYIYVQLNRAHEYYPVISDGQWSVTSKDLESKTYDDNGIIRSLQRIGDLIKANEGTFEVSDQQDYLSDYCHMMGRYYIRSADYTQGLSYIQRLVELNEPINSDQALKNIIKANRQKVCVYMNRYEPEPMRTLVEESITLLAGHSKPEEQAIWMRLSGMSDIMSGDLSSAQVQFSRAIELFEKSLEKEQYRYNLAASYAGLGEAKRLSLDYPGAFVCYEQAITVCKDYYLGGGAASFYTYAGQAALDSQDLDRAEEYLTQAVECFSKIELLWERSIAFAYYGLLCFLRKRYADAVKNLEIAETCSQRLGSRYEQGVLNRIYAWIAIQLQKDRDVPSLLSAVITQAPQVYIQRARALLDCVYSPIDEIYLNQMEKVLSE